MSILGAGGLGGLPLASSIAGSLRNNAAADDRTKAEQATQKFQADENKAANLSEDVEEMEFSADRDVDGRLPYTARRRRKGGSEGEDSQPRAADAEGERGSSLDLEA
jgi:hypothetical protein